MRRTMMVGLLLLAGCSGDATTTSTARPAPKAGDKVIVPDGYISTVWDQLQARRESKADPGPHEPGYYQSEHVKARMAHGTGLLLGGALVEVLEVGDDFAAVDVVRDKFGAPGNQHGYIDPWWK